MYWKQRCSLRFFTNFPFGMFSFLRGNFSSIQNEKFPFVKINVKNRVIVEKKLNINYIDAYLHGTYICIELYHICFRSLCLFRIRSWVLTIRRRMFCLIWQLPTSNDLVIVQYINYKN